MDAVQMLTLADVLTPEDLAAVREGLAAVTFQDGRKTAGGDAKKVKANRQTDGADPKVGALLDFVGKAIARHPVFAAYARPARPLRLMFNRYGPGETYGMHVDDPLMGAGTERLRTDLSLTLFLDEPETYEGGGLVIDGLDGEREIRLPAGSMAIYATGALHQVTPVTAGVRTACVGWVQSLIRRGDEREILFDLSRVRGGMKPGPERLLLDKSVAQLIRLWCET
jgi:PKHD-type hydroxylase